LDEGGMAPLAEHYSCLKIAADAGDASAIASVRVLNDIAAVTPIVDAV
jgi:hypothetical protein